MLIPPILLIISSFFYTTHPMQNQQTDLTKLVVKGIKRTAVEESLPYLSIMNMTDTQKLAQIINTLKTIWVCKGTFDTNNVNEQEKNWIIMQLIPKNKGASRKISLYKRHPNWAIITTLFSLDALKIDDYESYVRKNTAFCFEINAKPDPQNNLGTSLYMITSEIIALKAMQDNVAIHGR